MLFQLLYLTHCLFCKFILEHTFCLIRLKTVGCVFIFVLLSVFLISIICYRFKISFPELNPRIYTYL